MTDLTAPADPQTRLPGPPQPGSEGDRLARLAEDIRARDEELVILQEDLRTARAEVAALRASTSWRITAPLRGVIRKLRGA